MTLTSLFAAHRIRVSRLFALAVALVLAVSGSAWDHTVTDAVLFMIGATLAGAGTVGRLWCSLYIAGYKDGTLITAGPYSVSRNPLYFFSALGAVGVGFATETITFAIVFALWFWLFYPAVIDAEERKLAELHGARFVEYFHRVPRFFPNWRLLAEPETYAVRPDRFRSHLFDALWFVWAVGLLEVLEAFHQYKLLPTFLTWYERRPGAGIRGRVRPLGRGHAPRHAPFTAVSYHPPAPDLPLPETMLPRWVTVAYLAYLVAPILLLLVGSFGGLWLNTLLPTGFTGRWYLEVAGDSSFRRAFNSSLFVAAATGAACLAIGLPLAYAVFRAHDPAVRAAARALYLLPIALPALVLAFGFILVFSSDTLPWLGSIWLLVAGHAALCLPYFLQAVVADMQRLGLATLEDAAESLGSGPLQRFFHVVLPALRHSILSGLIVVAALSIGEFQFSNLVAGFLNRTYPVVLLQAFYGATGFACAATVILLALALSASALGAWSAGGAASLAFHKR